MKRSIVWAFLTLIALVGWCSARPGRGQIDQDALDPIRIYAYREWQSTGVLIHLDDEVSIKAKGNWLYTPDEYNGPEGHPRYPAPTFYPLPGTRGGLLIGRIGEESAPFSVGKNAHWRAGGEGMLYLRINDDILSDNEGYVEVEIEVRPAPEEP